MEIFHNSTTMPFGGIEEQKLLGNMTFAVANLQRWSRRAGL
jgi:hypothetical protein